MAVSTQDFIKGVDLTELQDVSGSQMNQLVDAGQPASNKGLVLETTDTALNTPDVPNPDVSYQGITPTQWYRYLWLRKPFSAAGSIKIYFWNILATADATYLKWQLYADVEGLQAEIDEALANALAAVELATTAQTTADNADTAATNAQATATSALTLATTANDLANSNSAAITTLTTTVNTLNSSVLSVQRDIELINTAILRVPRGSFYLREQASAGVNGPNSVAGVWTQRLFTDIRSDNENLTPGYVTLNVDSTITISIPGKWLIESEHPCNGAATGTYHRTRWIDSTGNVFDYGTSEYADTTLAATKSRIQNYFEITEETIFKIEHIAQNSIANGFGKATNLGGPEIYGLLKLTYIGA